MSAADLLESIQRGNSVVCKALQTLLTFVSYLFEVIVWLRNQCYDRGILASQRPPGTLIISVGNLAVGGVGKTPVLLLLAKELEGGVPIERKAILSHGYRAKPRIKTSLPVSRGGVVLVDARKSGDEAWLLASRLRSWDVYSGSDRVASAHEAVRGGAQLLLVDDGFQHRRLGRDFDVVVLDGRSHLPKRLLPRELWREGMGSLRRADLLFVNYVEEEEHWAAWKERLGVHTEAPVVAVAPRVTAWRGSVGVSSSDLLFDPLGRKVAFFCAIASPRGFLDLLARSGAEILFGRHFPDHDDLSEEKILSLALEGLQLGAEALLCTEKDSVKVMKYDLPLPLYWPEIDLTVTAGRGEWEDFLRRVEVVRDDIVYQNL